MELVVEFHASKKKNFDADARSASADTTNIRYLVFYHLNYIVQVDKGILRYSRVTRYTCTYLRGSGRAEGNRIRLRTTVLSLANSELVGGLAVGGEGSFSCTLFAGVLFTSRERCQWASVSKEWSCLYPRSRQDPSLWKHHSFLLLLQSLALFSTGSKSFSRRRITSHRNFFADKTHRSKWKREWTRNRDFIVHRISCASRRSVDLVVVCLLRDFLRKQHFSI